jgi:hypothetical protein
VLARRRKREKPDSPLLAGDLAGLGSSLLGQARWAEAEGVLRECLAVREKVLPGAWQRFDTLSLLGESLAAQGKYAEAEPMVVQGYEGLKARAGRIRATAGPRVLEAAERVVRLYESWGRPEKSAEWKKRLGLEDLPAEVFTRP